MMRRKMKKWATRVAAMFLKIITEQQRISKRATYSKKMMNSLKKTHPWKSTLLKPFSKKFRANTMKCNSFVKSFKKIS